MAKSLGIAPVDLNNDGWIDFVVANDQVQNFVLSNRHNGTFAEVGAQSGVAFDPYGLARGAMGIDSARFRNDNALGIAIGNFANEPNALYVAQNDSLLFADEAITEGIGPASRQLLKFGLFFFDYDLDGRLDVLTANGHIEEEISKIQKTQTYRQPAQLFWNRSSAKGPSFVPVPPEKAGEDLFKPIVGRGSAYADIDGDGDLDVVLTQIAGPPLLLRNDQRLGHHWLKLKLVGAKSNRDAIGAWVKVRVAGRTLAQQVMPAKGYLSQSELPLTFGLGNADARGWRGNRLARRRRAKSFAGEGGCVERDPRSTSIARTFEGLVRHCDDGGEVLFLLHALALHRTRRGPARSRAEPHLQPFRGGSSDPGARATTLTACAKSKARSRC